MNFSWLKKINRLNDWRRAKYFWLFIASAIILLAVFIIYPAAREILSAKREITQQKELLQKEQTREYALKNVLASYRLHEPKIEFLNRIVMQKNRELEFITSLEDIAARYNLRQKIDIGNYQIMPGNNFSQMPLQLQLEGNFIDELAYLQELERLPVYINIKHLNFTATGNVAATLETMEQSDAGNIVTLAITADTFWQ
jgi:hypothetical protein